MDEYCFQVCSYCLCSSAFVRTAFCCCYVCSFECLCCCCYSRCGKLLSLLCSLLPCLLLHRCRTLRLAYLQMTHSCGIVDHGAQIPKMYSSKEVRSKEMKPSSITAPPASAAINKTARTVPTAAARATMTRCAARHDAKCERDASQAQVQVQVHNMSTSTTTTHLPSSLIFTKHA